MTPIKPFIHSKAAWLGAANLAGMTMIAWLLFNGPHAPVDAGGSYPGDGLYYVISVLPVLALFLAVNSVAAAVTLLSRRKRKAHAYQLLAGLVVLWPASLYLSARFL